MPFLLRHLSRPALPYTCILAFTTLALVPLAASAQTNTWISPTSGNWSLAGNWSQGTVPNGSNGSFYDVLNSSAQTITYSALSPTSTHVDYIHSYQNTGTGGLTLTGDVLAGSLANAGSTFQSNGSLLNGGTLRNFTLINSNALSFTRANSVLDNVALDGGLTLNGGYVNIVNGLSYASGATFNFASTSFNTGALNFETNFNFANANLNFGNSYNIGELAVDSSHTLTLASSLNVTGVDASFVGGPMINNTLLSSKQGGTWSITPAIGFVNNGVMEARNANSSLNFSGGSLTNTGTIQAVGGPAGSGIPNVAVNINVSTFNNSGVIKATGGGLYGGQVHLSAYNYNTLGTIQADGANAAVYFGGFAASSPSGYTLTLGNGEHLSATNGGKLYLATTLNNYGQTFNPDAYGSTSGFGLSGGMVAGGTIANSDDLAFIPAGSTPNILQNVTLSGGLDLTTRGAPGEPGEAEIQGDFHYGPNAVFNIGISGGELDFVGDHTLDNATVKINGGTIGISAGTLTLGSNLTVQGNNGAIYRNSFYNNSAGGIINNTTIQSSGSGNVWNIEGATVANNGTLSAINGGYMSVVGDTSLTNTGTLQIGSKSSMTVHDYTQTNGRTAVDGTLYINPLSSAPFGQIGTLTLQGGALTGTGTIEGNVINSSGVLHVAPATLTLGSGGYGGDYTQGASGSFIEDIAGFSSSTQYGVFATGGAASLNGTLDINLLNGFSPSVGSQFTFLTYASETGMFTNILSLTPGYDFSVSYLPTGAVLTVEDAPAAVPEASTTVSFGLLLALGMGGAVIAARKKKTAATA